MRASEGERGTAYISTSSMTGNLSIRSHLAIEKVSCHPELAEGHHVKLKSKKNSNYLLEFFENKFI
jgi:hypothetical protein